MRRKQIMKAFAAFLLAVLLIGQAMPAFAVGQSSSLAKKGNQYIVTAKKLNCRYGPGMGYGVVAIFEKGTRLTYYGNNDGWWKVISSNGTAGYVDRQYLTPVTVEKKGNYFVTATSLNIRKQPKMSAGVRGTVKKGTIVTVSKQNGDWGYVSAGASVQGWAALKYLSKSQSASAANTAKPSTKKMYEVVADVLNVRSGSSTRARKIDTIRYGEDCYILALDGNWGRIVYKEKGKYAYGWVNLDYLREK